MVTQLIFKLPRVMHLFSLFPYFLFCFVVGLGGGVVWGFVQSFYHLKRVACSRSFPIPEYQKKRKRGEGAEQDGEGDHSNKTGVISAHYSSTD